eukprot:COSAG06_NODE_6321_length_2984_cov_1.050260_6_plen_47_part_01
MKTDEERLHWYRCFAVVRAQALVAVVAIECEAVRHCRGAGLWRFPLT